MDKKNVIKCVLDVFQAIGIAHGAIAAERAWISFIVLSV